MSPRIAFTKTTHEGLHVDVVAFGSQSLLVLTRQLPGTAEVALQVLGLAMGEVNTPTDTWYYEYEPLPDGVSRAQLQSWLRQRGYTPGYFDQFGNFELAAA